MDILTVRHLPIKSKDQPLGVEASEVVEGVLKDLGHEKISYGHWMHSPMRYFYLFANNPYYTNPNTMLGKLLLR